MVVGVGRKDLLARVLIYFFLLFYHYIIMRSNGYELGNLTPSLPSTSYTLFTSEL